MRTLFAVAVAVAFGLVMAGAARAQSAAESEAAAEIAEAESEYAEWAKPYGSMARTCNENTIQNLIAFRTEFPSSGPNGMELQLFERRRDHQERLDHPKGYLKTYAVLFPFDYGRLLLEQALPVIRQGLLESEVAGRKEDVTEIIRLICSLADESHGLLESFRRAERQ